MFRRFRALVLLSVLFWQLMSAFGAMVVTQRANELEHMVMHGKYVPHHHHADQTLHLDDAALEINHLHADPATSTIALMQSMQTTVASVGPISTPESVLCVWLSPTLEGPLRPPTKSA
jgi:hypothetical protein